MLGEHGWALSSGDYGGGRRRRTRDGGRHRLAGARARPHHRPSRRGRDRPRRRHVVTRVDASSDPELFWALRGAGAGMGVVTASSSRSTRWARSGSRSWRSRRATSPASSPGGVPLSRRRRATSRLPHPGRAQAGPAAPRACDGRRRRRRPRHDHRTAAAVRAARAARRSVGAAHHLSAPDGERRHRAAARRGRAGVALRARRPHHAGRRRPRRSGCWTPARRTFFQIRSVGGAVADVAADATAYAHRVGELLGRRHRRAAASGSAARGEPLAEQSRGST